MPQQLPHTFFLMELLQNRKFLMKKSNICDDTDGCADQYRCATSLYLLSMLYHLYNIVIDCCFGSHGHGKDVFMVWTLLTKGLLQC